MRHYTERYFLIQLFSRKRPEYGSLQAFAKVVEPGQILPTQRRFAQGSTPYFFKGAPKVFVPGIQVCRFLGCRLFYWRQQFLSCLRDEDLKMIIKIVQVC